VSYLGLVGAPARGRPSKFTPERIQLIKDLIARGETCEEIAARMGVTVGTLKVTCFRLGVSLRRPNLRPALRPLRASTRVKMVGPHTATFTIITRQKGEEYRTELALTPAMIGRLALEAGSQGLTIGELAGELVLTATKKKLIQHILEGDKPASDSQPVSPAAAPKVK
jgi:hypothetical protein